MRGSEVRGGASLDEFSIFARPPYRGIAHAALTRAPPSCLSRGGDACVLGVVEREGMRCTGRGASEAHAPCEVLGRSILPEPIEAVGT